MLDALKIEAIMKIDGKKMRMLLDLINEDKKSDLGHLDKGLEIEDKNGSKYTIIKVFRSRPEKEDEKGDIESLIVKYYDIDGRKKKQKISKEQFLKLFKVDKKKSKNKIKGSKND